MTINKEILSFWRDLEIFNLPDADAKSKAFKDHIPLPWQLAFERDPDKMWRHYVYLGKRSKGATMECIEKNIDAPKHEADFVEVASGFTCMAMMVINEDGCPLSEGGYIQASYLHGLWCLKNKVSLTEVNNRLEDSQQDYRERYPLNPEAENLEDLNLPIITWAHLRAEIDLLNKIAPDELRIDDKVHIVSKLISRNRGNDTSFLNSFYLDDLNQLVSKKELGTGLAQFLRTDDQSNSRVDVLANAKNFFEHINPAQMGAGKWPSNPDYGLYAAQLGAVNNCLTTLKSNKGIIGVNGPPGTGKTTLLKDIIAETIVEKAKKLITHSGAYFSIKSSPIKTPNFTFHYYEIEESLFEDSGIVVASNNNTAVENISKELPALKDIDNNHFGRAEYLKDFAQELIEEQSWGVLAAALGNSKNKAAFKYNFWSGNQKEDGFSYFLQQLYNNKEKIDHSLEKKKEFNKVAIELGNLLSEFERFKSAASEFHEALPSYLKDQESRTSLTSEISSLEAQYGTLRERSSSLQNQLNKTDKGIESIQTSLSFQLIQKPSFFFIHKLFNTQRYKIWMEGYAAFMENLRGFTVEKEKAQQDFNDNNHESEKVNNELEKLQKQFSELTLRMEKYLLMRTSLKDNYGITDENLPDAETYTLFDINQEPIHKMNPWSSEKLNILRSTIFLKSLQLHELAIYSNPKPFWNNLNLFMTMLDGRAKVSESIATGLWKTFFFCVPVVSTSLASVNRLFGNLKPESIAWLLVDEAGQATPQSLAGVINRSKRSVIIGDPKQIKPVVTIPEDLVNILNAPYNLDMLWSPLHSSAQELADRVSTYGSLIGTGENEKWTGFPLRTHRRCNNPMFEIANAIAYDNQMVKAMADVPFDCVLGDSTWYSVEGTTVYHKQVVKEEIDLLCEKLLLLKDSTASIYVISPFKSVASECKDAARNIGSNASCGTIHTFQGKEADIVFLVLGSDPASAGSRTWASNEPNMLNVALTRAKRRFYVIGNKTLWSRMNYFSELNALLPDHELSALMI